MFGEKLGRHSCASAAVCYGLFLIIQIILSSKNNFYGSLPCEALLFGVGVLSVIALVLKNRPFVFILFCIYTVIKAYSLVSGFSDAASADLSQRIWDMLFDLTYAVMTLCLFLLLRFYGTVRRVWFVPCILLAAECVFDWFGRELFNDLANTWSYMLLPLLKVAAVFFLGLWLKKCADEGDTGLLFCKKVTKSPRRVAEDAERMKIYKDLLDRGIITQEEFAVKKKQFLDL